jgi:hypothetical protein
MTNPIIDRSGPGVRLTLLPNERAESGEPLDLGDRLTSFSYEDSERRADKVSLQLDNFDLSLFDREELMGGAVLEVSWGYAGNTAPPRRVVVRSLKGFTSLTVEGQALSVLMNREARTRCWENATRSDVARTIAQEHGYDGAFAEIDDTEEVFDAINQTAETDARFLRRLASREEYEFLVDESGFHFHERRQHTAPAHVFTWYSDQGRGDVISINVESDLVRRAGRVTVRGRDPMERRTVEASASNENAERATLSETIEVVDPETGDTAVQQRNATANVRPTAATTEGQVRREAAARHRRAERATIKISMQVVGDPTLRAGTVVEVRGISSLLSGRYYLDEVKHTISSSGYTCDLKLTKDGTGRRPRRSAQPQRGERNRSEARTGGEMAEVEVVDPETGATNIQYRREGRPINASDPEARRR